MKINRRRFLQAAGASAAVSFAPTLVRAAAAPRVVVIGGGFAGATVAKYLRLWSNNSIDVTLVDRQPAHVSCVLSNLVLNDRITLNELTMNFGSLSGYYGIDVRQGDVETILQGSKQVRLAGGGLIEYDYLVVATGIAFKSMPNLDFNLTPHAWIAGPQTSQLATRVASLGAGDTFVMTVPKSPYRCPPGPYERACLVADILKRKGYENSGARVVVLDENPSIQAERHTFETAFGGIYRNLVEYVPNAEVQAIDSAAGVVETSLGTYQGKVVNPIPRQQAPGFVQAAGLTDGGDWASVDPLTYGSTVSGSTGVYVIGDSQNTGQPKSAHMANSQAKVCADAIIRELAGLSPTDPERVANVTTNSACYSPITYDEASWLTANFAYDTAAGAMKLTHIGEAERWSSGNYRQMFAWASNLFTDTFH